MEFELVKRLPEYKDKAVFPVDLSKINELPDPSAILSDNDILSQIFSVNPATGFPSNDIDILENMSTNPEIREYLLRCMKQLPRFSAMDVDDDLGKEMIRKRNETYDEYVGRLQSYITKVEEVSSSV